MEHRFMEQRMQIHSSSHLRLCFCPPSAWLSATMTDITDDIAEEITFQTFEDDYRLLGSLLNDVLQREVGTQVKEKVERMRVLAQVPNMTSFSVDDQFTRIPSFCPLLVLFCFVYFFCLMDFEEFA